MANEARFPIGVPVETNASAAADDVESLRNRILASTEAIRAMAGTKAKLTGTTDEIKRAKDQLTASIAKEKAAMSDATVKLLKQGTTYDAAAQKAKKFASEASVAPILAPQAHCAATFILAGPVLVL